MSTKDLGIFENGSGGEVSIQNNDLMLSEQLYLQAYLACFGGNIKASTKGNEPVGQVRLDWWGNSCLLSDTPSKQFNSSTEKALRENPLTSAGRINIIQAVQNDLKYLSTIAKVTVDATVLSSSKIKISVALTEPANNQTTLLQVIWDNAKNELIIEETI